jgi:hypothetical protein
MVECKECDVDWQSLSSAARQQPGSRRRQDLDYCALVYRPAWRPNPRAVSLLFPPNTHHRSCAWPSTELCVA